MQKRDELNSELNKLTARAAELRGAEEGTDELISVTAEIRSIQAELEVLAAREVPAAPVETVVEAPKSLGRTAADQLSGAPVGTSVRVERAIIADPWGDVAGAADVTWPQVTPFVAAPQAPVRFIDILRTAAATSDAVTYVKETGFENAAAARLAGDPAAESMITFEKVSEPVANVAHFIRIAEETLSDASYLSSVIDARGIGGVRSKINSMLLASSSGANAVKSVVAQAVDMTYGNDTATGLLDAIYTSKAYLTDSGLNATHVVLSPTAAEMVLTAKTASGDNYLANGPFSGPNSTVWGLPIVVDALPEGVNALVLDSSCATLYVRQSADVATDRDIVSNLLTVRVQTRAQVAVEIPEGIVRISVAVDEG